MERVIMINIAPSSSLLYSAINWNTFMNILYSIMIEYSYSYIGGELYIVKIIIYPKQKHRL